MSAQMSDIESIVKRINDNQDLSFPIVITKDSNLIMVDAIINGHPSTICGDINLDALYYELCAVENILRCTFFDRGV